MPDIIALLQDGLAHQRGGRLDAAEDIYRAVLATQPGEAHALHWLGLIALATGRAAEAEALLAQAAAARPDHDQVQLALGRAMLRGGHAGRAIAHFAALAAARPLCAAPRANLALARLRADDPDGALADADAALARDGAHSDAWFARGTALGRLRRPHDAVAALGRAVAAAPDHAEARLNLGNALLDLDRRDEAETHLRHAIRLDPTLAEAHASLGCLLSVAGHLDEAIACCEAAIALRPDFAQAHWNQSFAYMLAGDYGPGWEKYEWRKRHDAFARDLMVLPGREWQGEALAGETILVRAEQGLGDTIQFSRYLPMLAARGAEVVLMCDAALVPLLERLMPTRQTIDSRTAVIAGLVPAIAAANRPLPCAFSDCRDKPGNDDAYEQRTLANATILAIAGGDGGAVPAACGSGVKRATTSGVTAVPRGAEMPRYDLWIDQMSLPRLFGTRPETIPGADGFLVADQALIAAWETILSRELPDDALRVGVVWAGNPRHSNDFRRSMDIERLAPLFATPGCAFVSLQVGAGSAACQRFGIADRSAELVDLARTAALAATLDVVVSVDSCVAHLAGALGVPAWVMLPFAPDWRWMVGRTDTPWYASVRLYRQSVAGDWRAPVARCAADLALAVAERKIRRPSGSPPRPGPCGPAARNRPAASPSPVPACSCTARSGAPA